MTRRRSRADPQVMGRALRARAARPHRPAPPRAPRRAAAVGRRLSAAASASPAAASAPPRCRSASCRRFASARLIQHLDYISSVSGGGYTGAALALRYAQGPAAPTPAPPTRTRPSPSPGQRRHRAPPPRRQLPGAARLPEPAHRLLRGRALAGAQRLHLALPRRPRLRAAHGALLRAAAAPACSSPGSRANGPAARPRSSTGCSSPPRALAAPRRPRGRLLAVGLAA